MERWPSGLRYTPGKRAYGFNRTEGSNPSLSAKKVCKRLIYKELNNITCFAYVLTCIDDFLIEASWSNQRNFDLPDWTQLVSLINVSNLNAPR